VPAIEKSLQRALVCARFAPMMRGTIALLCFAAACGGTSPGTGGDGGPIDGAPGSPMLISGGGVANGPVAGTMHVFVVEHDSATPIAGAHVQLGDGGTFTGTTDSTGLVTFTGASLTGAQTVTATSSGHAAATWFGANGADVTIPLTPAPLTTPTAHATGTIAGWDQLASPSLTHYNLGVILYSFVATVSDPANGLTQATGSGGAPADTCLTTFNSSSCAWQLTARTGAQVHYAMIVDGNTNGTPNDVTDDTYTLIGYAAGSPTTLSANQTQSNESLAMIDQSALTSLSVSFPSAPSGLAHLVAIPMLDLGADGKIPFALPTLTPQQTSTKVLAPTGSFAGTYDMVALATPNATTKTPYSTVLQSSVTLPSVTIDAFLAAPTGLAASGGTYSFAKVSGASLHYGQFATSGGTGTVAWSVAILDGSSSFALPKVSPDPLPTGTLTFTVTAAEVPGFDAASFKVPDLTTHLHRASGAQTTFTH
jgi:hypothetical protein